MESVPGFEPLTFVMQMWLLIQHINYIQYNAVVLLDVSLSSTIKSTVSVY